MLAQVNRSLVGRSTTTRKEVWDITESCPIPQGALVFVEDFDDCGGEFGLFVVEYRGRIYQAEPDELSGALRRGIRPGLHAVALKEEGNGIASSSSVWLSGVGEGDSMEPCGLDPRVARCRGGYDQLARPRSERLDRSPDAVRFPTSAWPAGGSVEPLKESPRNPERKGTDYRGRNSALPIPGEGPIQQENSNAHQHQEAGAFHQSRPQCSPGLDTRDIRSIDLASGVSRGEGDGTITRESSSFGAAGGSGFEKGAQ